MAINTPEIVQEGLPTLEFDQVRAELKIDGHWEGEESIVYAALKDGMPAIERVKESNPTPETRNHSVYARLGELGVCHLFAMPDGDRKRLRIVPLPDYQD